MRTIDLELPDDLVRHLESMAATRGLSGPGELLAEWVKREYAAEEVSDAFWTPDIMASLDRAEAEVGRRYSADEINRKFLAK